MSSEVSRNYPLHILNLEGNTLLTTIPKNSVEPIFLEKNKKYFVNHQSGSNLYQFEVQFIGVRTFHSEYFCLFQLISVEQFENIRKDFRQPVVLPASFIHNNSRMIRLGNIVDISENGFKLETLQPIHSKTIHISYEDNNDKHYRNAEIMWSNKQGEFYYYGLKSSL